MVCRGPRAWEAKALRRRIDRGEDPAGEKRERREAATMVDLVNRYVDEHLPKKSAKSKEIPHLAKAAKYRENDEKRMLDLIAQHLGRHTKVADVHAGDIKAMHEALTQARGPVRGNRILAIASKAFTLSLVPMAGETEPWRDAVKGNPCKHVPRNHEEERGQLFSPAQLAAIADALAEYPGVAADCVRLIMFTGCRPSEAMIARWTEFDREEGCWNKPSAHTKQRKEHRLPLAPPALELIARLREIFVRRDSLDHFIADLTPRIVTTRYPGDAALIEEGRRMVASGMEKRARAQARPTR